MDPPPRHHPAHTIRPHTPNTRNQSNHQEPRYTHLDYTTQVPHMMDNTTNNSPIMTSNYAASTLGWLSLITNQQNQPRRPTRKIPEGFIDKRFPNIP